MVTLFLRPTHPGVWGIYEESATIHAGGRLLAFVRQQVGSASFSINSLIVDPVLGMPAATARHPSVSDALAAFAEWFSACADDPSWA
jgi:hypothetical protein